MRNLLYNGAHFGNLLPRRGFLAVNVVRGKPCVERRRRDELCVRRAALSARLAASSIRLVRRLISGRSLAMKNWLNVGSVEPGKDGLGDHASSVSDGLRSDGNLIFVAESPDPTTGSFFEAVGGC